MIARIGVVIVSLVVLVVSGTVSAQDQRAQSILYLDQSELRGPFYQQIFRAFRERVTDAQSHITIYTESLDLSRFGGAAYEQSLRQYLRDKYRDRPIGVIVVIGVATLDIVQRWRAELWPGIPVVFGLVDENDIARVKELPDVTGGSVGVHLSDAVRAARAVVPNLDGIAFVGD